MDIFQITLIIATLLCSLVGGFLVAFAIVIMPGISNLNDREFIQTFQVIDRVIQNSQPLFIFLWVGSIIFLITSTLVGIRELNQTGLLIMILAVLFYLLGVQLPTATVNVPLNNKLQKVDINTISESKLKKARENFEARWVKWNSFRTIFSVITSLLLLILLLVQ